METGHCRIKSQFLKDTLVDLKHQTPMEDVALRVFKKIKKIV